MGSRRAVARLALPAGLVGAALALRALTWPEVFFRGRTFFADPDAYYHMRRVAFALERFPAQLGFDPYLNFPDGARAIWPAAFDMAVALFVLPAYWLGGLPEAERAAAWIPVLLGAATVAVLYCAAQRIFDVSVAAVAAAVLCVLWGHVHFSQLGYVDHHAAVAFVSALLLSAMLRACLGLGRGDGSSAGDLRSALHIGALLAGLLWIWPGGVLHVAIVELGLVAWLAFGAQRAASPRIVRFGLVANALAFVLVLPAAVASGSPQWSPFSSTVLSGFQAWLFGATMSFFALGRWSCAPAGAPARLLRMLAVGVGIAAVSAVAIPDLLLGLQDAWQWLARDELFQGLVRESRPLYYFEGGFDPALAERMLSRFVHVAPLAIVALVVWGRRRPQANAVFFLAGWSAVLGAATLQQARFSNSFAVALALLFGWSAVSLGRFLEARAGGGRARRVGVWCAVALVSALLLLPSLDTYRVPLRKAWLAAGGAAPPVSIRLAHALALVRTAEWIRAETPATSGWLDPSERPEYGILAHWQYGHLLEYVARRPTVVGNFGDDVGGDNLARSLAYPAATETEAAALLESFGARYVVVRALDWGVERRDEGSVIKLLSRADLVGVQRHRLLFERPVRPSGAERIVSYFRVFELVAGALVEGNARPGEQVVATLQYETTLGRRGRVTASANADVTGRYRLRLAQPSETDAARAILPLGAYEVRSGARAVSISVPSAAVVTGARIEAPDLR